MGARIKLVAYHMVGTWPSQRHGSAITNVGKKLYINDAQVEMCLRRLDTWANNPPMAHAKLHLGYI